jgi:hypothetical protein
MRKLVAIKVTFAFFCGLCLCLGFSPMLAFSSPILVIIYAVVLGLGLYESANKNQHEK